ncbi:hypothetical protein HPT29_024275 [Microvirga terrae]|uniref:Uncharacterized protein n=1 Tax=Microvirga terrae TaxID=2740529 RepID=A0ABY5RTF6_9HYPH|nr:MULTISPECIES: hypothetical protein [Microvirga]MBQ0821354.1 hypothetical protein [Microvirga sp. HBU67558]UVF19497.1 hypothetical protein HPT29_024275 [Microvirga terrae]
MAESQHLSGLDGTQSVSALGLRWAALRGMLNSPLIMADEQRGLRDELVRELAAIEQDFSGLPSRTTMEISAKLDIARSALRERVQNGETWLADLIESIQADLHAVNQKPAMATAATAATTNRSPANLSRPQQRSDETGSSQGSSSTTPPTGSETATSSAA